eukprot:4016581-Prorocentrum_lima.AAC.1
MGFTPQEQETPHPVVIDPVEPPKPPSPPDDTVPFEADDQDMPQQEYSDPSKPCKFKLDRDRS